MTAYANSKATDFLDERKIENTYVPTGVKHAHPVVKKYDIGANDEANGHGTVTANWARVNEILKDKMDTIEAQKIVGLLSIFNMTVGDAICNMLAIECILKDLDYSIQDFADIYQENYALVTKAIVDDRTKFKVVWNETKITDPIEL